MKADCKEIANLLDVDDDLVYEIQEKGGFVSSGVAASILGVSSQTLRNYHYSGQLIPAKVYPKGHRRYSLQQLVDYVKKEEGDNV